MIDWLPHVAEAPAALYACPWGRAQADAAMRRADAEDGLLRRARGRRGERRLVKMLVAVTPFLHI